MKNRLINVVKPIYHKLYKYNRLKVNTWSPYENIYHCCTQKTGSQWFREIFRDPVFFKYTGLKPYPYIQLGLNEAHFSQPLPKRTIGIHLYIGYSTYRSIPKPDHYKAFFLLRDPRDIVVSWYFSIKYSHRPMMIIPQLRKEMESMSFEDGMKYCVDTLSELGLFTAQRSWMENREEKEKSRVFKYEDFALDNFVFLRDLLDYLEVQMPPYELDDLYNRHTFEKITSGRNQGEENKKDHYRKGVPGDWKEYFTPSITNHFTSVTGDLLEVLEYLE